VASDIIDVLEGLLAAAFLGVPSKHLIKFFYDAKKRAQFFAVVVPSILGVFFVVY
jgi:hypothetical protein